MDNIIIENASIGRKNFGGRETDFNDAGKRNFCVYFSKEMANELEDKGWPVKYTKPDDEGNTEGFLPVSLRFDVFPPTINLINSRGKRLISEDEVSSLDDLKLKNIDVIIRPYAYDFRGKTGIKAYLKALYATIDEDEFALKYADIPDIT